MTSVPVAPRPSASQRGEDWLWATLPGTTWPRSPVLGMTLSDGGWLRAWPGAALAVPAIALLLGLYRGGFRPADQQTYSYSLVWILVLVMTAAAGCAIGLWILGGFVVADAVLFDHTSSYYGTVTPWTWISGSIAPRLVSYVLLALLLVGVPFTALIVRGCVYGVLRRTPAAVVLASIAAGLAAAVQAAAWSQAFPLLIRPMWTWSHHGTPPTEAIAPVQQHPLIIGTVAGVATGCLAWLSFLSLVRLGGLRLQPVPFAERARSRVPVAGPVLRAVVSTLLLAGLIDSYRNGAIVFVVLLLALCAQAWLIGRLPPMRWWIGHVPMVLRLLAALVVAWLVAWRIGRTAVTSYPFGGSIITASTFSPLLYGCVAAIAVTALLLPRPPPPAAAPPSSGQPDPKASPDRPGPPR